jgi:hypothetical protein
MNSKFKLLKISKFVSIFTLIVVFLISFSSCKKKLEKSPEGAGDDMIILKKDEPLIKNKEPKYSYPPNVESVDLSKYTIEDIEKMSQELDMKGFNEGNKRYYKNKKHLIFIPEQIPTIYEHKQEYFNELNELW